MTLPGGARRQRLHDAEGDRPLGPHQVALERPWPIRIAVSLGDDVGVLGGVALRCAVIGAAEDDEGHGDLRPARGRPGPTTAVAGDHGVGADDLFDLPGEDLLAAPVDDVVGPGVEVDEAVGILVPEVARAQPAVRVEAVPVRVPDVVRR